MALLGNSPDAYDETWHLPCDPHRPTYADMIEAASEVTGRKISYTTLPPVAFKIGGLFNKSMKEFEELLSRYQADNIFDSSKFAARFPEFKTTTYRAGIAELLGT
jgi:hypothetical protein